jgi:hypothetical protein
MPSGANSSLVTGDSMFSADLLATQVPTPGSSIRDDVPELTLTMAPARQARQHVNEGDLVLLPNHSLTESATSHLLTHSSAYYRAFWEVYFPRSVGKGLGRHLTGSSVGPSAGPPGRLCHLATGLPRT